MFRPSFEGTGAEGQGIVSASTAISSGDSSRMELGPVAENLRFLLQASVAPSSLKVYNRSWTLFVNCTLEINPAHRGPVTLPVSIPHLSIFVSYLHTQRYSPASVVAHTSSIGYIHRLMGLPNPVSATIIQKLLAGVTRVSPPTPPRLPITIGILVSLLRGVDQVVVHHYHRALLKAMLTVGFFGLMRIGELTKTKENIVPLNISQLTYHFTYITISITHFKHNQSLRPLEVPLQLQSLPEVCPVRHLSYYLSLRGYEPGPLFSFPTLSPIPRQFFSKHLSNLISFSGFQGDRYKSHSLRIGGASYYASLGYTDTQIRLLGRWESNSFVKYIRSARALYK